MLHTNNINYIEISLLETQLDLILDALQLYAFNFHKVWAIDTDSDLEDLRNSFIFHTYSQIQSCYNSNCLHGYRDYDLKYNCRLYNNRKRLKNFRNAKKVA